MKGRGTSAHGDYAKSVFTCYGEIRTTDKHFRWISQTTNGGGTEVRGDRCGGLVGEGAGGRVRILYHGNLKLSDMVNTGMR